MCAFCLTSAQINIVHAVVKTSIQYMRQKKKTWNRGCSLRSKRFLAV